jgi:voltage-gated potassium channel
MRHWLADATPAWFWYRGGMARTKEEALLILQFRAMAVAVLGVLTVGTVFYHHVEHLRWLDSIYFSVVTLATVGYGDITPHTDAGKVFTIFFILVGVGILGTFVNLMIRRAGLRRRDRHERRS